MIRQEAAALGQVVGAAGDEGGADDAGDLGEEGVVVCKGLRVVRVFFFWRLVGHIFTPFDGEDEKERREGGSTN